MFSWSFGVLSLPTTPGPNLDLGLIHPPCWGGVCNAPNLRVESTRWWRKHRRRWQTSEWLRAWLMRGRPWPEPLLIFAGRPQNRPGMGLDNSVFCWQSLNIAMTRKINTWFPTILAGIYFAIIFYPFLFFGMLRHHIAKHLSTKNFQWANYEWETCSDRCRPVGVIWCAEGVSRSCRVMANWAIRGKLHSSNLRETGQLYVYICTFNWILVDKWIDEKTRENRCKNITQTWTRIHPMIGCR